MAQTIDVVLHYACGKDRLERQFADFEEAVGFALDIANTAGRANTTVLPSEVRVVEQGSTLMAIKVYLEGLMPPDARGSSPMSSQPHPRLTRSVALRS